MHSCKVKVLYRSFLKGEVNLAKNLDIVLLADFYENQRKFIEYYYSDDLSLSEIAQNEGITRQGVRDAVKRAETQLYDMEKKLGFAARSRKVNEALEVKGNAISVNVAKGKIYTVEVLYELLLRNAQKKY